MRERLSVNQSSSGLYVLDQLAGALMDDASDEDKKMAFMDPIMLLPEPARQHLPDPNINSVPVIYSKCPPLTKVTSPSKLPKKTKQKKSRTSMKEAATETLLGLGKSKPSPKVTSKTVTPPPALGKRKKVTKSEEGPNSLTTALKKNSKSTTGGVG
eukprot:jgi/Phyca11/21136/fgenesh1_pg.PHYCAscaffold_83_\